MSKIEFGPIEPTTEEKAWIRRLSKVLHACPEGLVLYVDEYAVSVGQRLSTEALDADEAEHKRDSPSRVLEDRAWVPPPRLVDLTKVAYFRTPFNTVRIVG